MILLIEFMIYTLMEPDTTNCLVVCNAHINAPNKSMCEVFAWMDKHGIEFEEEDDPEDSDASDDSISGVLCDVCTTDTGPSRLLMISAKPCGYLCYLCYRTQLRFITDKSSPPDKGHMTMLINKALVELGKMMLCGFSIDNTDYYVCTFCQLCDHSCVIKINGTEYMLCDKHYDIVIMNHQRIYALWVHTVLIVQHLDDAKYVVLDKLFTLM